jgi:hypothetical protein
VSSPSTCRDCCEVHRAAQGVRGRVKKCRIYVFEMRPPRWRVTRHPASYCVRPLGGTRTRSTTVLREGLGARAQAESWGETAVSMRRATAGCFGAESLLHRRLASTCRSYKPVLWAAEGAGVARESERKC